MAAASVLGMQVLVVYVHGEVRQVQPLGGDMQTTHSSSKPALVLAFRPEYHYDAMLPATVPAVPDLQPAFPASAAAAPKHSFKTTAALQQQMPWFIKGSCGKKTHLKPQIAD